MKKFLVCAGATLAFWGLFFFGPAIIMLLNNVGYYVSGGGYGPDSFMYKVLYFFSQPTACLIAVGAAEAIGNGEHKACTIVNSVLGALLCFVFAMVSTDKTQLAIMIISAVALSVVAVMRTTKKIKKEELTPVVSGPEEKNHAEKQRIRNEIAELKAELKEQDEAYERNRKILAEAVSDEEVEKMIASGRVTEEKAAEYLENKKILAALVEHHPETRMQFLQFIDNLEMKLSALEANE